jgi:hypothetical protein
VEWRKAWKAAQSQFGDVYCSHCESRFNIEDDGLDASLGGAVRQVNVSPPGITGMTFGSGSRTGGEALYINGSALDVGTLSVKFGGKLVQQVTNRTGTQARVVTPVGQYTFNVLETITPGFVVGEGVTGLTSGARGAIKSLSPFVVDAPTRAFVANEEVVGTASGASLRLKAIPYSGAVDVTVENEYGQRVSGGTLVNGFSYL